MISERIFAFRNRLLTSAKFRSAALKVPVIQWLARRQARQLFALCSGFVHSQVLLACVRLGLFDRLRTAPVQAPDVAAGIGLPAGRAEQLMRAAAALKLLDRRPDGAYGLGVLGAAMIENESLRALVEHHALLYSDLSDPVRLLAEPAAETDLSRLWPYARSAHPDALAADAVNRYTDLMAASQSMIAEQVLAAFPMARFKRLLDIGGGAGVFIMAVAERWPHLELKLVDLPAVSRIAAEKIRERGLGERVEVIGADATAGVLPAGNDLVSLVRILHDHDDERAHELLRAAHASLRPGGTLLVAEPLADPGSAGALIDAYFSIYLLAMGSGRPRSRAELGTLLQRAGFDRIRRRKTRVPLITSVLEARRKP